jgi:hypothetical protein
MAALFGLGRTVRARCGRSTLRRLDGSFPGRAVIRTREPKGKWSASASIHTDRYLPFTNDRFHQNGGSGRALSGNSERFQHCLMRDPNQPFAVLHRALNMGALAFLSNRCINRQVDCIGRIYFSRRYRVLRLMPRRRAASDMLP